MRGWMTNLPNTSSGASMRCPSMAFSVMTPSASARVRSRGVIRAVRWQVDAGLDDQPAEHELGRFDALSVDGLLGHDAICIGTGEVTWGDQGRLRLVHDASCA